MRFSKPNVDELLTEIRRCQACAAHLPLPPRPILQIGSEARIAIIGQAPGRIAHEANKPWNDQSGERLRAWLHLTNDQFYDPRLTAIVPMGFCYPGVGKSGDLPPRKECAPLWHERIFAALPRLEICFLVGQYAQNHYLKGIKKKTLTETVRAWREYAPRFIPLPHPSPRNNIWLEKNSWFEAEILPAIRAELGRIAKPGTVTTPDNG